MGNGLVLKFKGNKSFVAFSNLGDADALTKTWKVCTKVAAHLEQGQRLENLSWRLWHLQNLLVESDNAKSKREFRKLSKHMGEKLDKEKGRSIEELSAPRFQRNQSTDKVRKLAEAKERIRDASNAHLGDHRLNRMQFTFSVDSPPSSLKTDSGHHAPTSKLARKPTDSKKTKSVQIAENTKSTPTEFDVDMASADQLASAATPTAATITTPTSMNTEYITTTNVQPHTLRFPTLFSDDFAPTALLYPTFSNYAPSSSYGEGVGLRGSFGITRPTIEVPLDELLANSSSPEDTAWLFGSNASVISSSDVKDEDLIMSTSSNEIDRAKTPRQSAPAPAPAPMAVTPAPPPVTAPKPTPVPPATPKTAKNAKSGTAGRGRRASRASTVATAPPVPAAPPAPIVSATPGSASVKSECVNCGATHTPLWRRGLNDELNCNACGLYCKLHKRPRPKTMRTQSTGGGNAGGAATVVTLPTPSATTRSSSSAATNTTTSTTSSAAAESRPSGVVKDSADSMGEPARCVNCHTMATPLWRKDDEGQTVCNACGLYFKLHNSNRPISMKSEVVRKRPRADQYRPSASITTSTSVSRSETPSITSRSSSPDPEIDDNSVGGTPPPSSAVTKPKAAEPNPFDRPFNFPADDYDFPGEDSPNLAGMNLGWSTGGQYVSERGGSGGSSVSGAGGNGNNTQAAPPTATSGNAAGQTGGYTDYVPGESLFPGPFHPDYLRNLGVRSWDVNPAAANGSNDSAGAGDSSDGSAGARVYSQTHNTQPQLQAVLPKLATDRDRMHNKRRRLSTDSYESSISATDPPSSASSMFPHDNSSTASFSSLAFSAHGGHGHRNSMSDSAEIHAQEDDVDFPMNFLHHAHQGIAFGPVNDPAAQRELEREREMMAAFLQPNITGGGQPNDTGYHVLPFSGGGGSVDYGSSADASGEDDYLDVTMGLFNTRF